MEIVFMDRWQLAGIFLFPQLYNQTLCHQVGGVPWSPLFPEQLADILAVLCGKGEFYNLLP